MQDKTTGSPPFYAIGQDIWPGLAKLTEECGELLQVLGKVAAYPGCLHPDGSDVLARLHDELADVRAAVEFFVVANDLDICRIERREASKVSRFLRWHQEKAP